MSIEWGNRSDCWVGKTPTGYPRFEVWDSTGAGDGRWSLRAVLNPGTKPIEVSELHSLDEARQFAAEMLTGLDGCSTSRFPAEGHDHRVEEVLCMAPPAKL